MSPLASVRVVEHSGVPVAAVEGELDITNVAEIGTRLLGAVSNVARGLVVDFTRATYLDSRGVHLLLDLAERLRVHQQQLRVVVPVTSILRKVFVLTHLDTSIPMDETVEAAVEQLQAEP